MFHGPGDLRLEEVARQPPGPGEIAVEVRAAATCGTDLKSYRRGHPKLFPTLPARFGHEFAGVVTEVGEGVTEFASGTAGGGGQHRPRAGAAGPAPSAGSRCARTCSSSTARSPSRS